MTLKSNKIIFKINDESRLMALVAPLLLTWNHPTLFQVPLPCDSASPLTEEAGPFLTTESGMLVDVRPIVVWKSICLFLLYFLSSANTLKPCLSKPAGT